MSHPGNMPTGKGRQSWQPALETIHGGQSSIVSNESFVSQVPLPYYMEGGFAHQQGSAYGSPQMTYGPTGYQNNRHIFNSPAYAPGQLAQAHHTGGYGLVQYPELSQSHSPNLGFYQDRGEIYSQPSQEYTFQNELAQGIQPQMDQPGYLQGGAQLPAHITRQFYGDYSAQGGYMFSPQAEHARAFSPVGSMTSQASGAHFGSAQLHVGGAPPDHDFTYRTRGAPRNYPHGRAMGHGGHEYGGPNRSQSNDNTNNPISRPQRQPNGPSTHARGGFRGRGGHSNVPQRSTSSLNQTTFNPAATPYAPQSSVSTDTATQQGENFEDQETPRRTTRSSSRSSRRNSFAEARRESHEAAMTSALESVGLSSKNSRSSLAQSSSDGDDFLQRTPALDRGDSSLFESETPTRQSGTVRKRSVAQRPQSFIGTSKDAPPTFWPTAVPNDTQTALSSPVTPQQKGNSTAMERALLSARTRRESNPFNTTPAARAEQGDHHAKMQKRFSSPFSGPNSMPASPYTPIQHNGGRPMLAPLILPKPTLVGPSLHLVTIVGENNNKPSLEVAFQDSNVPFVTSALLAVPPKPTGLIRIMNVCSRINILIQM